jgi:uncharacterized protein with PQ loop repeat
MAVKMHIYSAASFFSFFMLLPQVLGFWQSQNSCGTSQSTATFFVRVLQLFFFFQVTKIWLIISGPIPLKFG